MISNISTAVEMLGQPGRISYSHPNMMDTRSPSHRRIAVAVWLALAAVVISAAAAGYAIYSMRQLHRELQTALDDQAAQTTALTTRLDLLEKQAAQNNAATRLDAVEKKLTEFASLTDRLSAQQGALQDVAAKLSTLDAAQHQLTSTVDGIATQDHASLAQSWQLALNTLNDKADAAVPFTAELQQLKKLAVADSMPLLQTLADLATNPPPTVPQLRDELNVIAVRVLQADTAPRRTLWARFKMYLQNFVTVRPLPNAVADTSTITGKVAKALYHLDQHDLASATQLTADMPSFAAWHTKLAARQILDDTIAQLAVLDPTTPAAMVVEP